MSQRSGCCKLTLKARWEFWSQLRGRERDVLECRGNTINRSRSRKNLASSGNGQQFDRREIANFFLRTGPLPSVDFDTLGSVLTWPVWDLSSLRSATTSHCKKNHWWSYRKTCFACIWAGGEQGYSWWEGCPGGVVQRQVGAERFMCLDPPAGDLKCEVRCSESSYHNANLLFLLFIFSWPAQ